MKPQVQKQQNSFETPFNSQKQLQQHVVDRFAKHGNKVRYQFKIKIES